jgi:molybdopterin/thiamine biosynthesis adenylyltransferase/rhodanese-related sulfurtransferase
MSLTYQELVRRAKEQVTEVEPADLEPRLEQPRLVVIDVREIDEYEQGAVPGSRHIPRGLLESTIGSHVPQADTEIVLYCAGGARSALAAQSLQEMGYGNVRSLRGGFGSWKSGGHAWSIPVTLSSEQRSRYSRHILLPEVGEEGQHKLLDAKILLIGAGGLGSPAALYLAAAGVGTLGIVDFDQVDSTNLQRQILHNLDRIGQPKVESARETLTALNPDVKIEPYTERLSAENVIEVLSGYDLVVDGADNFPTRYLLNDASLHLRIPVVHGSVFRFEGQATVFDPYNGPCYRCLFPEPPPPELAPSCAEAGVLGVLPGIIGSIEAMEAIKLVLGIGDSLVGRLLIYDALDEEFRTVRLRRHPSCPSCSDESRPPRLVEYDDLCLPGGNVERVTAPRTR